MSGGSWEYSYYRLEEMAGHCDHNPLYRPLKMHLLRLAKVLHELEWNDSGDSSLTAEQITALILSVVSGKDVEEAAREQLKEMEMIVEAYRKLIERDKNDL